MASISWLHLTDLHMGMGPQRLLWPDVKEDFYGDLKVLHAKSGPWDLVLFTGDLTQNGTAKEFKKLGATLDDLWAHLKTLGSMPALVMVPGNHDLVRPDPALPEMATLKKWHADRALRERFWSKTSTPERKLVADAFKNFKSFARKRALPNHFTVKRGRLPGDVSVSFEHDGMRVALVGLNTAFLHLWKGDLKGQLAVDLEQRRDVCGEDPPAWIAEHDVALLLTHHPEDWLHPTSRDTFRESVLGRERFVAHLHGHMHEPRVERQALGGAPERRVWQGPSLFGLDKWGEDNEQRVHGYMAGRITIGGAAGEISIWPRLRKRMDEAGGHYKIVPAQGMDLTDDAVVTPFKARRTIVPAPPVVLAPTLAPSVPSVPAALDFRAVRRLLGRFFDASPRIRMLLRDAEVDTSRVRFNAAPDEIWAKALERAQETGRLRRLLDLASEEYPSSDELRALASSVER